MSLARRPVLPRAKKVPAVLSALAAAVLTTVAASPAAAAAPPAGSALPAASITPAASTTPAASPSGSRAVAFAGVTVRVPADWPVVDVDGVPGCVRYDRHAVYLGEPSESTCPARVIGGIGTVQILPAASSGARPVAPIVRVDHDGRTSVALGRTAAPRVIVTADPTDSTLADSIVAGARIDGAVVGATAVANATTVVDATAAGAGSTRPGAAGMPAAHPASAAAAEPSGAAAEPAAATPVTFSGKAFDTCTAPTQTQMTAWRSSPYDGIGIYVGGISMGCDQPELTPDWVTTQRQRGWHLLPLYVPLQAPCARTSSGDLFPHRMSNNPTTAATQGTNAANSAVRHMGLLGLGAAGNPIYVNLESWDNTNTTCTTAAMAFTDAWTEALHQAGYVSGYYSSAGTGVVALVDAVQHQAGFHPPDAVWFARWDDDPVTTDPAIPAGLWSSHRRVKQYAGPHDETHGGRRINIDSDVVDAPVVPTLPTVTTASLPNAVPGKAYSNTVHAQGGVTPYSFAVTSGTLPAGLSLSTAGKITGAAESMAAPVSITITVTDARGATVSHQYSIAVTFSDVPTGSGFFGDIAWVYDAGIVTGYPDGTYRPAARVTRQSMAAFLYRNAGASTGAGTCAGAAPFPDVDPSNPFCGEITWLASTGITGGYTDGTFRPTSAVTRGSMAAFLYRSVRDDDPSPCDSPPFPDVPTSNPFCGEITWLASTGITGGYTDGTFRPASPVSRQSMAAFLHRLDQQ